MPPSHAPHYYVLIPLLAIFAFLAPQAFLAVTAAISVVETISRLPGRR